MTTALQPRPEQSDYVPCAMRTPLKFETRATVDTNCAAYHLNRAPQTLRIWSCRSEGPIRALRINGRLAWPV